MYSFYDVLLDATAVKGHLVSIPKTEAINGRLVSKCTAHIRSRKIWFLENNVTAVYCSTVRG